VAESAQQVPEAYQHLFKANEEEAGSPAPKKEKSRSKQNLKLSRAVTTVFSKRKSLSKLHEENGHSTRRASQRRNSSLLDEHANISNAVEEADQGID